MERRTEINLLDVSLRHKGVDKGGARGLKPPPPQVFEVHPTNIAVQCILRDNVYT